jgi:calcium-translocating P-type ATPase
MTMMIGHVGMLSAAATFLALIIRIWVDNDYSPDSEEITNGIISAFILAVTIVVVAIPEGLPLAVTISLAYSTKKMYADKCSIRQLAACETMGNATTICSDKTGTLTENRMTVVEGWFGGVDVDTASLGEAKGVSEALKESILQNVAVNRTAYLVLANSEGVKLETPLVIGNKTEGALINMIRAWGGDYDDIKEKTYNEARDKIFPFDSTKKRSSAIIKRGNGVRLYCKGATEMLLADCSGYTDSQGDTRPMTAEKNKSLTDKINGMAQKALRTLMLAHIDYESEKDLPANWRVSPPIDRSLICDCIVGIIDPLRSDVKEAVAVAQRAGVVVRMVTG